MRRLLVGLMLLAFPAVAADVQVYGRSFTNSCSYYTNTWGDYDITFRDTSAPWGTKVTAIVAFGGYRSVGGGAQQNFAWDRDRSMAMTAVAPYTWRVHKSETLHSRTSNFFFTHLNFIFKVESPGRAATFVNGGSSWGHYQVAASQQPTPCVTGGADLPGYALLPVRVVEKQ